MFLQSKESSVLPGRYIKQLSIGQVIAARRHLAENQMQTAGAELIAESYYTSSALNEKLFSNSESVLSQLPPSLFERMLDEVAEFSGLNTESSVNPTE